jgi:hypothetical protein
MTSTQTNLRLRRTVIAGTYCDNDWCVYENGRSVGRIYRTHAPGGGMHWRWFVQVVGQVASGSAETLDEAKAAFRGAWERSA